MTNHLTDRLTDHEIQVLKGLAEQVAEIAQHPRWKEKEQLWYDLNSLKKTRPMVMAMPPTFTGWDEIIPPSTYVVNDYVFRTFEKYLRQDIYRDKYFRDDVIITNKLYVPKTVTHNKWHEDHVSPYDMRADHSAAFHPCIIEKSDLYKLTPPKLKLNKEQSDEDFALAQEIFGDYLDVIQGEPLTASTLFSAKGYGASMIDLWCELRGLGQVYEDLAEDPDYVKEAMSFLSDAYIDIFNQGIDLELWTLNNNGYHPGCCPATGSNSLPYSKELPQSDFNGKVRLKDLWGYFSAQEMTAVSPKHLEECILPYQAKVASLFGLNAFGCCENNDLKWDVIKKWIPNLRLLSVSPFSSLDKAVEKLEDKYVICWKPHPTNMVNVFNPEYIRKEMRRGMEVAKDSHMAIVLRDFETVMNEPHRISTWIDITMGLAEQYS